MNELTRISNNLIREIDEFPRAWKNQVLFHGLQPLSRLGGKKENIYDLCYSVSDVIRDNLG